MITIKSKGTFKKTNNFLSKAVKMDYKSVLIRYAQKGVEALRKATPYDTGLTENSWYYEIVDTNDRLAIEWKNSNTVSYSGGTVSVAILLQYGHVTGTGGYVQGLDYINPAIRPAFKDIADSVWKEVTEDE